MSYKEAIKIFNKQFPKLSVLKCIDYDDRYFVIEAVEDVDSANYNDPYFGVNKSSGKITGFIPTLDLDAFFDAADNRTLYSTY